MLAAIVLGLSLPVDLQGQVHRPENLSVILSGSGNIQTATSPATAPNPSVFDAHPGPWGQMKCAYVYLEAPASLIEEFPLPSPIPRWTFPLSSLASLPAFFAKAGLSESLVATILTPKHLVKEGALVHLLPPLGRVGSYVT